MYAITILAVTTAEHPDHGRIGEAYVDCWIDRDDEEDAIAVASEMIVSDGWEVACIKEISTVTEADYDEDDEYRMYFEQAVTDKEVLVFNVCPMFPVFCMSFEIAPTSAGNAACEAVAWVANEFLGEDYDPMEPDFWEGARVERAIAIATEAILENGYEVIRLLEHFPSRRDESSDDCQFYDDAEENGLCLVFIHDQPD